MKLQVSTLGVVILALSGLSWTAATRPGDAGLSATEVRRVMSSLPDLPGEIQALQIFPMNGDVNAAAVLTDSQAEGWQLFVFEITARRKLKLRWKSGPLGDSFAVSSGSALRGYPLGGEQGIEFSGCAAHVCPDVFSVLLYVPSLNRGLIETRVHDKIEYAPPLQRPDYQDYRKLLDALAVRRMGSQ